MTIKTRKHRAMGLGTIAMLAVAGGLALGVPAASALPFTGMDLVVLAGVAILLVGTGIALRRLSAPRRHHT